MIRYKSICIILITCIMLAACSPEVDNATVRFVQDTKKQEVNYTGELPKYSPPPSFNYTASNVRDPFLPFVLHVAEKNAPPQGGGPDLHRSREPLEAYPLDSLKMVGTLERKGMFFVLLKDTTGVVHRAGIGNYVGQNSGKIIKINQNEVEIQEWASDGKGGWREQWGKILLSDPKDKEKGT